LSADPVAAIDEPAHHRGCSDDPDSHSGMLPSGSTPPGLEWIWTDGIEPSTGTAGALPSGPPRTSKRDHPCRLVQRSILLVHFGRNSVCPLWSLRRWLRSRSTTRQRPRKRT
jgi:hypothetical protein